MEMNEEKPSKFQIHFPVLLVRTLSDEEKTFKKNFLSLENSAKKIFFCMGRLRSTGFHDFRFSTMFGGRLCFL